MKIKHPRMDIHRNEEDNFETHSIIFRMHFLNKYNLKCTQ